MIKKLLLAVMSMLMYACSNDISMLLPRGPEGQKGADGESAYEVWVDAVDNGEIDWDEDTDLPGFFRYLKGKDGEPGADGKSAYQIWMDDVKDADGLDNPHTLETDKWPTDETDINDFYRYLMGEDGKDGGNGSQGPKGEPGLTGPPGSPGQSAYDLWRSEVAKGLDNPHKPGTQWPKEKISVDDFFEFLTGESGLDGVPGLPGAQGESAYDQWADMVNDGDIKWTEGTDPDDFFRYLKGKDGKDGIDGVDGEVGLTGEKGLDGQTAYDIWKKAVLTAPGLEDPHNPGTVWPSDEIAMNDFYRYMTGKDGADGISAYGQWVLDVRAGKLDNPHTPELDLWPPDQTTLMDFWHYLRGEDGEDGQTLPPPIVNPGAPGSEVQPDPAKYSVIALYKDRDHSEYVSPADGSVLYQVWLPGGEQKAGAGVIVKNMPGIPAAVEFVTIEDGTIKLTKEYLPTSGTVAQRYGAPTVNGESAAAITYVPQKIDVRLVIGNKTYSTPELTTASTNNLNGGAYLSVPVRAQRRLTSEGDWEDLPTYMSDLDRTVHAYAVDLETMASAPDPSTPNMNRMLLHRSSAAQDLRSATVSIRRPTMPVDWMPAATQMADYYMLQPNPNLLNHTPGVFTMVLDDDIGFYGENPHTRALINMSPVNFHPLPSKLEMYLDGSTLYWKSVTFNVVQGRMNVAENTYTVTKDPANMTVESGFLLSARYTVTQEGTAPDGGPIVVYGAGNFASDNKCFALNFGTANTQIGGTSQASVLVATYEFDSPPPVVINSYVYLRPTSILMAGPGNTRAIGRLVQGSDDKYRINPDPEGPFNFPSIEITIVPKPVVP